MKKKKILLLSDDLRMTSGIATMSKEIVLGTIHKYDWVQLGAAIKHPELGKVVVVDEDARARTGVQDASLKIIPSNGYGDIFKLRLLIEAEKPDAILHFTDPHYWTWLYDNEHEVRQQVPLLYYHIWDNLPDPHYNRNFFESCDWVGAISKQTYGIVHRVGKSTAETTFKPLEDWQIDYVPHGINPETFKPVDSISEDIHKFVHGDGKYEFVLFYNNRNIRRKQTSDVIYSFKLFCDQLPKEEADKCLLLMHTNPIDENGTDLIAVKEAICPDYNVKFTNMKLEQDKLNEFYNIADCTINIASNEGFGLTTAESVMAGTPIIVNVTGGLQDQCGFNLTADDYISIGSLHNRRHHKDTPHGEWVIPVWPATNNLNGSVPTPYIFDDRVDDYEVADAIMEVHKWGRENRKERGLIGREWAINNISTKVMCDKMIDGIETAITNFKPRQKFNLYKIV
jgi:glycosyltransferase involved in cell wall biosynthesis